MAREQRSFPLESHPANSSQHVRFLDSIARMREQPGRSSGGTALLLLMVEWFRSGITEQNLVSRHALLDVVEQRLRRSLRARTPLTRTDGDVFAVLLENIDSPSAATIVANRLLDQMEQPFSLAGQPISLGLTIGVSTSHSALSSPKQLLRLFRQADRALARAKENGRQGGIHHHRSLPFGWFALRLPGRSASKAGAARR